MPEFSQAFQAFWAGEPSKEYRDLPYPRVQRAVVAKVCEGQSNEAEITIYARPPAECRKRFLRGIVHSPMEVAMDYWIVFTLGRRLECACGQNVSIEVY